VILAELVRALRFHALAAHRPKPVARVTLRPTGGMPLVITVREKLAADARRGTFVRLRKRRLHFGPPEAAAGAAAAAFSH